MGRGGGVKRVSWKGWLWWDGWCLGEAGVEKKASAGALFCGVPGVFLSKLLF